MTKDKVYKCAHCGKRISNFLRNMEDYSYKITENNKTKYYCSYSHMRNAQKSKQLKEQELEKQETLQRYNNKLSLEECLLLDEACAYLNIDEIDIREHNDFDKFCKRHHNLINLIKEDHKQC